MRYFNLNYYFSEKSDTVEGGYFSATQFSLIFISLSTVLEWPTVKGYPKGYLYIWDGYITRSKELCDFTSTVCWYKCVKL